MESLHLSETRFLPSVSGRVANTCSVSVRVPPQASHPGAHRPGPSVLARAEAPCPWHAALGRTPWPWLGEERDEDTISYQQSRAESPVDACSYIEQPVEWSRQGIKKKNGRERKRWRKKRRKRCRKKEERMKKKEKERKERRKGGKKGSGNHLTEKWGRTCFPGPGGRPVLRSCLHSLGETSWPREPSCDLAPPSLGTRFCFFICRHQRFVKHVKSAQHNPWHWIITQDCLFPTVSAACSMVNAQWVSPSWAGKQPWKEPVGRSGSWPGSRHVLGHARAVDKAESAHISENQEVGADGDREDIQRRSRLLEDLEGVEWAIVSGLSGAHLFGLCVGLLTWDRGLTHCKAAGALGWLEDPRSCPIVTGGLWCYDNRGHSRTSLPGRACELEARNKGEWLPRCSAHEAMEG